MAVKLKRGRVCAQWCEAKAGFGHGCEMGVEKGVPSASGQRRVVNIDVGSNDGIDRGCLLQ